MMWTKQKRLEPWKPIEVLGVLLALNGSDDGEFERSFNDVTGWCEKVKDSHLQPHTTYRALLGTVVKTIDYRLPATQFHKHHCAKLTTTLYKSTLPKLGISQKLPVVYRHAPITRDGLGFPDFRLQQLTLHLREILFHSNRNTLNAISFHTGLELSYLHTGFGSRLWTYDYNRFHSLLPDCEIRYLWGECHHFQITLEGDYTLPPLEREHDVILIDELIQSEQFYIKAIIQFNMCRLYLQALSLSDIVTSDGKSIEYEYFHGKRIETRGRHISWPRQSKPPAKSWRTWREVKKHTVD